jgi:lipid A 4'-phosphatase
LSTVPRWAIAAITVGIVALAILVAVPDVDLAVSGWFHQAGEGFPLARLPLFLFVMKALPDLAIGAAVVALGLGIAAHFRHRVWLGVTPRIAAFLTLSLIIGPGLVVNTLLKDNWGRARPHQITEFGGSAHFSPAVMIADQCNRNCSFPSGHGALAFWLIAIAMVVPMKWRAPAMVLALIMAALVGAMRIAQGGHFLSDVIASALIVGVVNIALKILILDRPTR